MFNNPLKNSETVNKSKRIFQLTKEEKTILRNFTLSKKGVLCEVEKLDAGLSGAVVYRVKVLSDNGTIRVNAVAKMGPSKIIDNEVTNYNNEISRLPPSATPRKLWQFNSQENKTCTVFYSLTEDYSHSFFDSMITNQKVIPETVRRLKEYFSGWSKGVPMSRISIKKVRETMLDDANYTKIVNIFKLDWTEEFEKQIINANICTTHGDLHGNNILIDSNGAPIVIDYENVALRTSSIDPVTLELCSYFHTNSPYSSSDWPPIEIAKKWGTEEYINSSQTTEVTRSCFAWAESVSAGHREIAVSAYSYLLWQLKFKKTNKDRIKNVLTGVRNYYSNT